MSDVNVNGSRFVGWVIAGIGFLGSLFATLVLIINLWTGPINEKINDLKVTVTRIDQLANERGLILPQLRTDVNVNRDTNNQVQRDILIIKERIENMEKNIDRVRGLGPSFSPRR